MKKFAYASVLALALVAMISTAAFAGAGHDHGKKAKELKADCDKKVIKAGKKWPPGNLRWFNIPSDLL